MTAVEPFLRTILEQPEIDGPRLVFADWLEERGEAHAELIRVQCEMAPLAADDPRRGPLLERERDMLRERDDEWLAPVRAMGLTARFRRGFLEVMVTGIRTLLETGERLFALPWVLHVHLRDAAADVDDVAELAASPFIARLQKLDLSRSLLGSDGAFKLAASPFQCRLTHLTLNHIHLHTFGLQAILEKMDVRRLEELRLYGNGIAAAGGKALANSSKLRALRVLDLSYNSLGTIGGEYLAEARCLGQLRALFVRGNRIGTRGKKALRSRYGPRVHLGGSDNSL